MGTYSGVNQNQIRIETVCTNQFHNEYTAGNEKQKIKLAEAMGNSHCNLVSWKIMQLINQSKLNAQYTFLHIPRNMKPWVVTEIIDKKLIEFKQAWRNV